MTAITGAAGADGCPTGWLVVHRDRVGELQAVILPTAADLLAGLSDEATLVVDVPIGLPPAGPREADRAARRLLGWPRRTSVFPAPIRAVLIAGTPAEASRIRRQVEGKGMSRQAWGITGKVAEMDAVIRALDPVQRRVLEGHPEVSFAAMAEHAMRHSKKRSAGRAERTQLLEERFGPGAVSRLWEGVRGRGTAPDDLIDALAMLWTAERLRAGTSATLPVLPERDATGLRMEIVY